MTPRPAADLKPAADSTALQATAVRAITLTDFRNYPQLRLEAAAQPVILTGANGAGKTNLLEAISFLAPGRGLRRAKLAEIDRQGEGPWTVTATLHTPAGEVKIGTGRDPAAETESDKRLVKIDGKAARGHAELARHVSMVWLTPSSDQLFQEGQSARRKFLDRLVYGFDLDHAARVSAYEYAMRERNRLLSDRRADPQWLASLEHKMAETSAAIAAARLQTVSHLNQVMHDSPLHFPKAEMALTGMAEDALTHGEAASTVEQALAEALAKSRAEDTQSSRSSFGAHKSELSVMHLKKGMEAALCSTGEQKALLLSIVLAEARVGAIWHGRIPILLLDEVVAHLDEKKRLELYEEISRLGAQAWMSGTDANLFHGMLGRAQFFRVEQGCIFS